MRKFFALVVFVFLAAGAAWAQPTFTFSSGSPCTGENFCVDVTIKDFTDIASLKFPVRWDPKVIEFTGVQGLNLQGLTAANFDDSRKSEGLLFLNWVGDVCENPNPNDVTLPDGVRIFQLCFRALGGYGTTSQIEITDDQDLIDDPEPIIVKRPPACFNIGLLQKKGFISTCVRPLNLISSNASGNTGDLVCFDVSVTGFDGLTSLQFTMDYDSTILAFSNVVNTEKLRNLGRESFGTPDRPNIGKGRITMSWNWTDVQIPSITVPDSTVIFQVCFNIIGPCESVSELEFTSSLTPLEAINVVQDTQYSIPALLTPGMLEVGTCTPTGLQVIANCGPEVNLNDEVCVRISARGMTDLSQFSYLMNFNPNILRYKDVRILATNSQIPGFNKNTHFNTANVSNGVLRVNWTPAVPTFSATAPDGTVIYEVCFDVVGLGGNSPISFDASTAVVRRRGSNSNIGIAPTNCAVRVKQPDGVLLSIVGGQGVPGDTVCLDMNVTNFRNVLEMDFSVAWEPSHLEFVEIKNVGFPNASLDSFNLDGVSSGLLSFEWSNATPRTLADGETLFQACFIVRGTPPGELGAEENCDGVQVVDIPIVPKVVTSNSNGDDIGLFSTPADVCVLNPTGFYLIIDKDQGYRGDTICTDFRVAGFEGVTSAEFTVNWNPANLQYARLATKGVLGLQEGVNIDATDANVGIISFSWMSASGATLPDSTSIFEVCYVAVGEADQCIPIEVNTDPVPSATTVEGPGSVYPLNGEVCILDRLIITEKIITRVTCPDADDGTVSLKVEGGKGNIFFFWESAPRQFTSKAINLPVGKVPVTIFDESSPPLVLRDTFEIVLTDTLPQANAGPDRVLGCNPPFTLLSGSGSTGSQFQYSWSTLSGSLPGDTQRPNVIAGAAGLYVLTVFNRDTRCAVRDTVQVLPPNLPEANAGRDQLFSCLSDTLELSAALSSQGDTIAYKWTALDGGIILPGDETKIMPKVLAAGIYALEVRNVVNGCTATDTIVVENATEIPDAKAGDDQELNCTGEPVTLDAGASVNIRPVIYAWFDSLGTQIGTGTQVQVNSLGRYVLRVTEEGSGCIARDTMQVLPSSLVPQINAGQDTAITCQDPEPQLAPAVSNTTNFQVQWAVRNGGQLEVGADTTLRPKILAPGTYVLQIRDIPSSCVAVDSVVVREDRVIPEVEAGPSDTISCNEPAIVLTASASSPNGTLNTTWRLSGQTLNQDSLVVTASSAGVYLFAATDPRNGCTASDSVEVVSVIETPEIITLAEDPKITCTSSELDLQVTVAPPGNNYTISWQSATGTVVFGGNALNARVRGAGTYLVEATNSVSGCKGQLEIVVGADTLAPAANAGRDSALTCTLQTLNLSGIGSATGDSISYTWEALNGAPVPTPANTLATTVSGAGTFVLTVRNSINGCFSRDSIVIATDTAAPNVVIDPAAAITCTVTQVTLSGAGSSQGAQFTPTWSALAGQNVSPGSNPFQARVNQPGAYQLKVVNNQNGCEGSATVEVPEDREKPAVQVIRDVTLPCPGAVVTLSGQGSATGGTFTYLWTTLSGNGTITDERTLSPKINTAGTYGLQVTNTVNGCTDTAVVVAIVDPNLVLAQAGADQIACTDDAQITANLPAGTTGVWSSKTGASIETPNEFVTEVFSLQPGANVFVWTLSKAECPNYSADSLVVTLEVAPEANGDQVTMESGDRRVSVNVLQNDRITSTGGTLVSVSGSPNIGRIDTIAGGLITYAVAPRIFGMDEFTYQVCLVSCPTLCDTASVKVDVKFDPNAAQEPVANTITPNGDGANDELRFEVLDDVDPTFFPDNELIIFNRWGDIIYQARPYMNDWRGTNSAGQDLPQATYYYILRLDISKGLIIKGDVTIVK